MKAVLITGGAGAIGSRLSIALLERGYRVIVLDNMTNGFSQLVHNDAMLLEGDIRIKRDLDAAFAFEPHFVFHLAAFFANQNSVDHPDEDLSVNGQGTINVLRASVEKKVSKVLFSSSSCVYGNTPRMHESAVIDHYDTPYVMTKHLGEQYCEFWSRHAGLDTVTVRLFNSFGPGEFPGFYRNVIPNFFKLAIQSKPLPITGTGDEIRDFNYVGNTVSGMLLAMFSETRPGSIFNIASGVGTRIGDLAQMINEITGNPNGVEYRERRDWDSVSRRVGVIDRIRQELGYVPEMTVYEGLKLTYDWFRENVLA